VRAGKAEGGTSGIQGGSIYPTYSHTPEYLPSFLDQLAALCLWHGSGASNFLYQFTLWGSIILTVYSGAVYCVGARKFLQR
jgi:CDP-diacylglycerol---glycerol-3-phosphate 3-phosphatidyltransferase